MNKPIVLKKTAEDLTNEERNIVRNMCTHHYILDIDLIPMLTKAIELLSKEPEMMYVYWDNPHDFVCISCYKPNVKYDGIYVIPPGTVLTDLRRETWEALRDAGMLEEI
jgi:hypothetical protein